MTTEPDTQPSLALDDVTNETAETIPAPSATGIGSMPGQDMTEVIRVVMGELGERPGVPFLPELPQRGVGADMVGRGAALLVDLYAEVQPSGWRIVERRGRDHGRARGFLSSDLDLLEEYTQDYAGPLKIQAAGPWTLAATVELPHGDKLLADPGAVRDIAESLAEGLKLHVEDVRKRVPGAHVILQLDEPVLPGVLKGAVRTASGFGSLSAVEEVIAREVLRTVIDGVKASGGAKTSVIVHCCASDVPFDTIRGAGATGVSFDLSLLTERRDETLGTLIESGTLLFAGVAPSTDPATAGVSVNSLRDRVLGLRRLGFTAERVAASVVVTPTCGMAAASPAWSRRALKLCRDTAKALEEVD